MVEYRPCIGRDGYRVGDDGSVWSCWKKRGLGRGLGVTYDKSEEWTQVATRIYRGRAFVSLRGGGSEAVAELVLTAFVRPRMPREMIGFRDLDKSNSRLGNLDWVPLANPSV